MWAPVASFAVILLCVTSSVSYASPLKENETLSEGIESYSQNTSTSLTNETISETNNFDNKTVNDGYNEYQNISEHGTNNTNVTDFDSGHEMQQNITDQNTSRTNMTDFDSDYDNQQNITDQNVNITTRARAAETNSSFDSTDDGENNTDSDILTSTDSYQYLNESDSYYSTEAYNNLNINGSDTDNYNSTTEDNNTLNITDNEGLQTQKTRDVYQTTPRTILSTTAYPTISPEELLRIQKIDECNRKSVRRCRSRLTKAQRKSCTDKLVKICLRNN